MRLNDPRCSIRTLRNAESRSHSASTLMVASRLTHRRVGVELADDLPIYSGHSGKFMLKLITAWIAMGFHRPEITWGKHRAQ